MDHEAIYTNCLAFQLTQARKHVFAWYESYLAPLQLTPSYVYVLGVLMDKGSTSPSEIAKLLHMERPTVTALLDRMERNGLVRRTKHPTNRRELLVALTEAGRAACAAAYPLLVQADTDLNELLQGSFHSLQEHVKKLNHTLKE